MNKYLQTFEMMCKGMILKDRLLLDKSLANDAYLYHMTGKRQTKEEYINDILNGTLNYYEYEIVNFNNDNAIVKLLAKVYGGNISWWKLKMIIKYDESNKIKECKVVMA